MTVQKLICCEGLVNPANYRARVASCQKIPGNLLSIMFSSRMVKQGVRHRALVVFLIIHSILLFIYFDICDLGHLVT